MRALIDITGKRFDRMTADMRPAADAFTIALVVEAIVAIGILGAIIIILTGASS